MSRLIDIHCHSTSSDGEYSPFELIKLAHKQDIGVFSITDHDIIDGTKQLDNLKDDLFYIHGVEMSAEFPTRSMHILGYDMDINNNKLNDMIVTKQKNSIYNLELLLNGLDCYYGISFSNEDVDELFCKKGNKGRPDLARLCIKYGYTSTVKEAFDRYLIDVYNKVSKDKKELTKEEVISTLKYSNAFVSLAHPVLLKLKYEDLKKEILYLKSLGLDAIEVNHTEQNQEYRKMLREIVNEYNLFESGGTDYHGPLVKPDIELGTGINNNIHIKSLSLVDAIKQRKKSH